jgi:hypothetical protein
MYGRCMAPWAQCSVLPPSLLAMSGNPEPLALGASPALVGPPAMRLLFRARDRIAELGRLAERLWDHSLWYTGVLGNVSGSVASPGQRPAAPPNRPPDLSGNLALEGPATDLPTSQHYISVILYQS